jgi:release factor glutamine methyltransferase
VTPAVLIPRAETELIVEAALETFARDAALAIADACTGSGNLAISLAREFRQATVVATDVSEEALAVARGNASRLGVADRVRFVHADVLDGVAGPFHLIAGNPPYVRRGDGPALQPEVRDYEPAVALYGGRSGMDVVTSLVVQAAGRLKPGGFLMFEFGFGQEVEVEALLGATAGLTMKELRRDLQGLARTAVVTTENAEHLEMRPLRALR